MARNETYTDLEGCELSLAGLANDELKLVQTLKNRAATHPDWNDFDNFWMKAVADFYDTRGVPRKKSAKTVVFLIAQDLSDRIGVAAGLVRMPDYRDELAELIRTRFKNRREFCRKTRLSETMLSHVLSGRKHLALGTLTKVLRRIGYQIRIVPEPAISEPQATKRAAS